MEEMSPGYVSRCLKALEKIGAPLKDWYCVEVINFNTSSFECELCGCKKVRYIHVMCHDEYPDSIHVGCICAGVMEGDILAAKERDAKAKRRSQRKSHYLKKQWNPVNDNRWETRYKSRSIIIERDCFRGREFYTINLNGDQYQWKDNRRMGSFLIAQHYIFDLIESEGSQCKII